MAARDFVKQTDACAEALLAHTAALVGSGRVMVDPRRSRDADGLSAASAPATNLRLAAAGCQLAGAASNMLRLIETAELHVVVAGAAGGSAGGAARVEEAVAAARARRRARAAAAAEAGPGGASSAAASR